MPDNQVQDVWLNALGRVGHYRASALLYPSLALLAIFGLRAKSSKSIASILFSYQRLFQRDFPMDSTT